AAFARLANPSTVEDRRAKRLLWDDVKAAKERLSRTPTADLVIPLADLEVHLTRDEVEELARPLLDRTVRVTQGVIGWAQLAPGRLAGVFLVGGSSRIPLLATLLHRALGEPPVVLEQPELVVAEGSILAGALALGAAAATPGPATGLMPKIPVDAFGSAGSPMAAPVSPAAPASPAPVSPAPVSPAPAPSSPAPAPSSPAPVSAASASPEPAGSVVGRVIVPGAQPPGRGRRKAAAVAPTRPFPRIEEPAPRVAPAVPPPRQRPPSAAPRPTTSRPTAPTARPYAPRVVPPGYSGPRRGGFRRFLTRLFVTALLIAVPVVAAVIAYSLAGQR
ncbi:MAG TPA: Hsp70 family protein, partial [Micromonosporaceae bacterium]|nr:Hsp70 family protein [Micromonosporaceae bacterium]